MPNRRHDHSLEKVTLNLIQGDFARLRELYPRLGAGEVIRRLVHSHIKSVDEKIAASPRPKIEESI